MCMDIFKRNQNNSERMVRFIAGLFLISSPLIFGTSLYSLIMLSVGGILIFNAISGICMIYKVLGINTCKL